jgi:hypothetical protein
VDVAARKPTARSAVSNGTRLLAGIDGRSSQARRFRDLIAELATELDDAPSTAQLGAIRQAAALLERLRAHTTALVDECWPLIARAAGGLADGATLTQADIDDLLQET